LKFFAVDVFCLIAQVVRSMHGYLRMKGFAAGVSQTRNFHSACNFDIVKLNDKILPKSEQDLKFLKQIKKHFLQETAYEI